MAKYPFFAKSGRPSKLEQKLCRKINDLLHNGGISQADLDDIIDREGEPINESELQVLYDYIVKDSNIPNNSQETTSDSGFDGDDYEVEDVDIEEDIPLEETSSKDTVSDAINYNPFDQPVIDRGYTQGIGTGGQSDESHEEETFEHQEQSDTTNEREKVSFDDDEIARPDHSEFVEEDIPEPDWANTTVEDAEIEEEYEDEQEKEKLGGDNLQDLTPQQKRKSAEKTADALLEMYGQFAPLPFKQWASFKDSKIQKLILEGRINPNMTLENNVTVQDYINSHNKSVEEIFEVSDDTKESIKDPLVDVLLEQEIALTPTQRLIMAVGSHVVSMGFSAYQLAQNNKQALESFEKYHQQMKPTNTTSRPSAPSSASFSTPKMSDLDDEGAEEVLRELNLDDDDVIDVEHDPTITVEDTDED